MFRILFLFLIWGLVPAAQADGRDPKSFSDDEFARVAHSPTWLRLLHYRSPFLRGPRSDADSSDFFLSKEGKTDPDAELRATLELFRHPDRERAKRGMVDQPLACAFPARRFFLEETLHAAFPKIECKAFEEWSRGIGAKGASLVFSSAYPNNPASMFGHTFLRLDRDPSSREKDLRSYGVNFSAIVGPDENPVKYAIWGLIGGYSGHYDLAPYYRKVNEYAFSESRDLWEYQLSLSEAEVTQLVRHLWELYSQAAFDYYFLDENCSYQILTALEAVRPDWDLSSGFILSAIPVDTVEHVTRTPGAVVGVYYRPSLRNQMAFALDHLTDEDRTRVREVFRSRSVDAASLGKLQTDDLDALIAALAYERERGGVSDGQKTERASLLQTALIERSRRGKTEELHPPVPLGERPDRAHGSSRVSLSGGAESGHPIYGFSLYGFRHDFLDRTPSYNLFSEVHLFGFRAEKREGRDLRFEEADLLSMASMAPDSIYDAQKSWKLGFGWSRLRDLPETNVGGWHAGGGYGLGWNFFSRRNLVYALVSGEFEQAGAFRHGVRLSAGGDFGMLLNPGAGKYFLRARARPLRDVTDAFPEERWRLQAEIEQACALTYQWDVRFLARADSTAAGFSNWRPLLELQTNLRF